MAIVRFRPYGGTGDPLTSGFLDIRTEVNRLFDSFFGRPAQVGGSMEPLWAPTVDMYETKDEVVVTADLPGLNEKDIHLSITGEALSLKGERHWDQQLKDDSHYRTERWFGKFERSLQLPVPVQVERVKASYRDGVLTVSLPKTEEIRPKEIKIDVA